VKPNEHSTCERYKEDFKFSNKKRILTDEDLINISVIIINRAEKINEEENNAK